MPATLSVGSTGRSWCRYENKDGETKTFPVGHRVILSTGTIVSRSYSGNYSVTRRGGAKVSGLTWNELSRKYGDEFLRLVQESLG